MPGDTEIESSCSKWTWACTVQGHPVLAMSYKKFNCSVTEGRFMMT